MLLSPQITPVATPLQTGGNLCATPSQHRDGAHSSSTVVEGTVMLTVNSGINHLASIRSCTIMFHHIYFIHVHPGIQALPAVHSVANDMNTTTGRCGCEIPTQPCHGRPLQATTIAGFGVCTGYMSTLDQYFPSLD